MIKVYSASAGAGKTYNLVLDYLATCFKSHLKSFLALKDRQRYTCTLSNDYQHILAITFTNNAAAEMKERVIRQLNAFAFAHSVHDLDRNDFDNLSLKVFGKSHSIPEEECFIFLNETSKSLLNSILYNYARFSITTIDSFIQRVIRSSALYLNLNMNYAVQIRLTDFFQMAIEQYICELSHNEQQFQVVVKELLRQFEDQGAASINQFLSKGLNILYYDAEKSHPYVKKFSEISDLLKIIDSWKKNKSIALTKCKQLVKPLAEQALAIIHTAENDGVLTNQQMKWDKWFAHIQEDPFEQEKGFDTSRCHQEINESKIFTISKTGPKAEKERKEALKNVYAEQVKDLFEQVREIVLKYAKSYFTCHILGKNANPLLVLSALKYHIENIKEQTDSFFLVESNPLLNDEILSETNGGPLFEKLSFYKHFFIDEFQDTSLMQWQDLKPLIINSLSENGSLTLFGDVKQSIYRFRNGEAELFYRLSDYERLINTRSEQDLVNMLQDPQDYLFEPLKKNYRSRSSVIEFNNHFFRFYSNVLEKSDYYSDVEQSIRPDKKGGLVQIYCYNKLNYKDIRNVWEDCPEEFYKTVYLKLPHEEAELLYAVMDAKKRGYAYGDMAILLSGRSKCNDFAQCLIRADIPVITSESLQLCDNPNINLIISTLRFLLYPSDTLAQTVILDFFSKKQNINLNTALNSNNFEDFFTLMENLFEIQDFRKTAEQWKKSPFLITLKDIILFYGFARDADPFIADFFDLVLHYTQTQIASIADFLVWWDDINLYRETIPRLSLSKASNAIRIMTIHGSKGLEFPVVITHTTAESNSNRTHYWITDASSGQSCYVKHEKNMQFSDFQNEYEEEEDKCHLDRLNLWYVDFTRARDMLYILTEKSEGFSDKDKKPDIKKTISQFINNQQINVVEIEDGVYSFGDFDWQNAQVTEPEANEETNFRVYCSDMSFCGNPAIKVNVSESNQESLDEGTLIHDFLQKLTVFPATQEEREATLAGNPEEMKERLNQLFNKTAMDPALRPYFYLDPEDSVLNEAPIITGTGEVRRPDRIVFKPDHVMVIDYKTGKEYKAKYESQLKEYQECMQEMGYQDVRAKILYID